MDIATAVSRSGAVITVSGTGRCVLSAINPFNAQGGGFDNIELDGTPQIPLRLIDDSSFSFSLPSSVKTGSRHVEALNAPFVTFSRSASGPGGAFIIQ